MAYASNRRRTPEFYKLYRPEHSSESLLIPDAFVRFCNRLLPKNVVLSNDMGSLWHVIADYIDGGVFFLNGWKKFVEDNSIECGDFLIFRYDGECGFSVKIFGQSACEKIESNVYRTPYMNKVKLEEETKENDNGDEGYIDEKVEEEDSTKEEEAIKRSTAWKQSSGNIGGSKKQAAVIDIEDEEEESNTRKRRARNHSCGNNGVSKKMPVGKIGSGSKRTNIVPLIEEVDVPKYFLPRNPFFIAKLKARPKKNLLHVPSKVLKCLQHKLRNETIFRNELGRQWPGNVINWKDGRIFISGWNDFCKANQVSPDDQCICEFLQGNDNQEEDVINVRIIRNAGSRS